MSENGVTIRKGFRLRHASEDDLDNVVAVEEASFAHAWPRAVFEKELTNAWSHLEVLSGPDDDLVGRLGDLAGTALADMGDAATEDLQYW